MIRRVLLPASFLIGLVVFVSLGPRQGVSLLQKSQPSDLDMSPMGRIAAGLDPVPVISTPAPD